MNTTNEITSEKLRQYPAVCVNYRMAREYAKSVGGLLPTEALTMTAAHYYGLRHFSPAAVLENRLLEALLRI